MTMGLPSAHKRLALLTAVFLLGFLAIFPAFYPYTTPVMAQWPNGGSCTQIFADEGSWYIDCDSGGPFCTSGSLNVTAQCAPVKFLEHASDTCGGPSSYTVTRPYTTSEGGDFSCNIPPCIDIGLRIQEVGQVVSICGENPPISPLRIAKNGTIYGVSLVDPSDQTATAIHIGLPGNIIKALRKL